MADKGMGALGLGSGGRFARADGPNWFIGNDCLLHLRFGKPSQTAAHLGFKHFLGHLFLALGKAFTDANDWLERSLERGERLFGHDLIRLMIVLPALRMTHNDVAGGKFLQHAGRDFAGIRAETMLADVLRAEADVRVEHGFGNLRQRSEGGADYNVHLLDVSEGAFQIADQVEGFGDGFVHLPIPGDDYFAFLIHAARSKGEGSGYLSVRAATPGRTAPSRNSRLAPPPVLMKVTRSARPALLRAFTLSPPPMMLLAPFFWVASTTALAMANVP